MWICTLSEPLSDFTREILLEKPYDHFWPGQSWRLSQFLLILFFLTNNLSHTILSCELIIEHSVFVWRVEIFLSESFHVSSEMTKRSWLFFLPSKIEKNGKQLFRCHEKCSWDKRRSEHVQHVCGQREAVNFTLMFLRLLIHVSSNSSLNLFHPTVGSLKSEKSKR